MTVRSAALCALVLAVSGCARLGASADEARTFPARAADSLLARPDLQALVDAQVRRDAGPLLAGLRSRRASVRSRAAFALASVQDGGAVDALIEALGDPTPAVRADAAFAIGQTADSSRGVAPRGVALLIALRTEATPSVQAELIDAIGKTGDAADMAELMRASLPTGLDAARALAVSRAAARGVTEALASNASLLVAGDPAVREAAAFGFARAPIGSWRPLLPAVRIAFDRLGPADPARMHLARALGRAAEAQDAARLAQALLNDATDWRTRANGASALGALRDQPAARAALAEALTAEAPHVAAVAASAFARIEAPTATELDRASALAEDARRPWQQTAPLLSLLARAGRTPAVDAWAARQTDPFAQAAALSALGEATDEASLGRLLARAQDSDARLAAAATEALRARWAATDSTDRDAVADRYFPAFSAALTRRDLATTSAAAPVLADTFFVMRGSAGLLRQTYTQMTAPQDIEPMVEIIKALGTIRDGQEVDFLVGVALQGAHPVLRTAARDALNERLIEGIDVTARGTDGPTSTTSIDWDYLARLGPHPRLILETARGRVEIELDTEGAPQTTQTIALAAAGHRYDGVPFHRVVPNFVVQGGDYFRRDGYGGPETPIRSEFTRSHYTTGTVGIASAGKDTEGVQFFVTHSAQPHLDGHYTVVGQVVRGQDVIDQLVQGDVVRRARIVRDPRADRRR